MKKRLGQVLVIFASMLIMLLGASVSVYAANFHEEQKYMTLTYGFDIETANGGKYAPYLIDDDKEYFSGGQIDYNNGLLIHSQYGATELEINLLDKHAGKFSVITQGFQSQFYKDGIEGSDRTNGEGKYADFIQPRFIFRSLDNPGQELRLRFVSHAENYLTLRMTYNDGTTQYNSETSWVGANRDCFIYSNLNGITGTSRNHALFLEYDNINNTLSTYVNGDQGAALKVLDLNAIAKELFNIQDETFAIKPFEHYSVGFQFASMMVPEAGANMIFYELCGQVLSGNADGGFGSLKDTATPVIMDPIGQETEFVNYGSYTLSSSAYDIIDGDITEGFEYEIYFGDTLVSDDTNLFRPTSVGEYTIVTKISDAAGNEGEARTTVTVTPDSTPPAISMNETYAENYLQGTKVKFIDPVITDNSGADLSATATVIYGDETIADSTEDAGFLMDRPGEYVITYSAKDNDNNVAEPYEIRVTAVAPPEEFTVEAALHVQKLPYIEMPEYWTTEYHLYHYDDTEKANELEVVNGAYKFDTLGKYAARYVFSSEEPMFESFYVDFVIDITDTINPTVALSGVYEQSYAAGTELELIAASVTDNTANATMTVNVFFGETALKVTDNKVVLADAGEYKVVYTAKDSAGNASDLTVEFVVENQSGTEGNGEDNGGGCTSSVSFGNIAILSVAVLTVCFLAIKLKKKETK